MSKPYFKSLAKFIKYKKKYWECSNTGMNNKNINKYDYLYSNDIVEQDLKMREDAEYNDLRERLDRHGMLHKLPTYDVKLGDYWPTYLENTMNIHLKENR